VHDGVVQRSCCGVCMAKCEIELALLLMQETICILNAAWHVNTVLHLYNNFPVTVGFMQQMRLLRVKNY
jgi:hypothetical protein